jgi:multiple sugar transport system substrate-binding protein
MTKRSREGGTRLRPSRRDVLRYSAGLGIAGVLAPQFAASAFAQADDLTPYAAAKLNWRQAEGEQITVAVIPASYFENLISLQPQFEALTGIKLRFEKVPPGQIRQKALLDLSSKTATYATHAADPMYYPLYVSNKWVEPLDRYLNDAALTDPAWFKYDDIIKAWRDADSIDGKPYGIPYDGEVTVQVYRKDLYDAKGLKPADTYEQLVSNAKALTDANARTYGLALRGFAGAGQNMYIYPSLFRGFGGSWGTGNNIAVNTPEALSALTWYVDTLGQYAPPAVRNWNWPDIADAFSQGTVATYIDAHSSAAVITNPEKSKVVGKVAYARWPKGPSGKRVTSLELGFPDQRGAFGARQESDLAVHRLGNVRGDASTDVLEIRRTCEALRHQPDVAVAVKGIRRGDERCGRQLHTGRIGVARIRHGRRLAPARAAVACHRRDHGDGDPGRARRPKESQGSAR